MEAEHCFDGHPDHDIGDDSNGVQADVQDGGNRELQDYFEADQRSHAFLITWRRIPKFRNPVVDFVEK